MVKVIKSIVFLLLLSSVLCCAEKGFFFIDSARIPQKMPDDEKLKNDLYIKTCKDIIYKEDNNTIVEIEFPEYDPTYSWGHPQFTNASILDIYFFHHNKKYNIIVRNIDLEITFNNGRNKIDNFKIFFEQYDKELEYNFFNEIPPEYKIITKKYSTAYTFVTYDLRETMKEIKLKVLIEFIIDGEAVKINKKYNLKSIENWYSID